MGLDQRKLLILAIVVEEYIRTGEPVGSKAILAASGMSVSSATVRNDLASLEQAGLIEKPHTSAGRAPTPLGYRLYIEQLMKPKPPTPEEKQELHHRLRELNAVATRQLLDQATALLSEVTQLMVVNANQAVRSAAISKIEVVAVGNQVYLVILITSVWEIKNKPCRVVIPLTPEQLSKIVETLNQNLSGMRIEDLTPVMLRDLWISVEAEKAVLEPLLLTVFELGAECATSGLQIHGKERLATSSQFDTQAVAEIEQNEQQLIELLCHAQGEGRDLQVIFGQERQKLAAPHLSLIIAPYSAKQLPSGTLGLIGPLRVNYAKMIPYMACFSDYLAEMLTEFEQLEPEAPAAGEP